MLGLCVPQLDTIEHLGLVYNFTNQVADENVQRRLNDLKAAYKLILLVWGKGCY
jgi:hypothetical protein